MEAGGSVSNERPSGKESRSANKSCTLATLREGEARKEIEPMAKAPAANAKLTKSQTAAHMSEKAGISKKQATQFMEELANLAYKQAKNSFTIPGIGKLVLVNRKAREGRNPATGEVIQIPAKKVVKFRVAKAAKDAILGAKK
jgi:DNA-binding protein HU-beta